MTTPTARQPADETAGLVQAIEVGWDYAIKASRSLQLNHLPLDEITEARAAFVALLSRLQAAEAERDELRAFVEEIVGKSARGTYYGDAAYTTLEMLDSKAKTLLAKLTGDGK